MSSAEHLEQQYAAAKERLSRLEKLVEVSALVSSTLGQDEVIRLMELGCEVVDAETGSVLLVDEGANELYFRAALGDKGSEVAPYRLKMGEGVAGWVAQRREPALVNDPAGDERFHSELAEAVDFVPRSMLCVPLQARGKLIGVVQALNKRDRAGFDESDVGLLMAFANQAAIALDNANLVERLQTRINLANAELIEANRELGLEKGRLEAIVRGMADGLIALDVEGVVALVNPAAELLLGVHERELKGKRLDEVLRLREIRDLVEEVRSGGAECPRYEVTIEEPERRILSACAMAVRDEDGNIARLIVALTDITALKELSEMKSDYVSVVSHELRTPLTSIQGFVGTLKADNKGLYDAGTRNNFYTIIEDECDRLLRRINALLDVSRLEAGKPLTLSLAMVDVRERLEEALRAQATYTDRHEFTLHVAPEVEPIVADPDRVDQIIANLLANAVKYSPDGGKISIEVRDSDGEVAVSVTDPGVGMTEEELGTIFERYARVETRGTRKIRGTGLGLFLCKQLVELHRGNITVDSQLGQGSTFTFTLPKTQPLAEADTAKGGPHDEATAAARQPP
ncbi:MAG: ATP-binding protein [Armatimonadota bacterium]